MSKTKLWRECGFKGCKADSYHLSSINEHPISQPRTNGSQEFLVTRQYKCTRGHIVKKDVRKTVDLLSNNLQKG